MWSCYTKIDSLEYPEYTQDLIMCNMHLNYFSMDIRCFFKDINKQKSMENVTGFFFCKYVYHSANIWVIYINAHDKGGSIFLWISLGPPKNCTICILPCLQTAQSYA